MKIKFWGVRGSIPTPEHRNFRYGGNTACVEVRLENGTLIILDCGSGFRALGKSLMREHAGGAIHAHIFLTHFHWDHIQGIPFFLPLYQKGNIFAFHAVERKEEEFKDALEGPMADPYFPVGASVMGATRQFFELDYGSISINGALISSAPLNHPQGSTAYRVDADGSAFVYVTDTEPGSPKHDRAVRDLALGADCLAYDAQYTPGQLQNGKQGWGHSSWLEGTRIARECDVSQLILFHHDPDHDDTFIDSLVEKAQENFPRTVGAAEGMALSLPEHIISRACEASAPRHEHRYQLEVPVRVAWQEERGLRMAVQALARNISKTGIYFQAPVQIHSREPINMELMLPDEITQRGPLAIQFDAEPIRQESIACAPGTNPLRVGVAARRIGSSLMVRGEEQFHFVA
jgi:phosphoribosyl 1,2-cyclic phosphodiesterase